jgi:magnesium transporter
MEARVSSRYSSSTMLTLHILHGDGHVTNEYSEQALTAALRDASCTFWLDIVKPTDEEIALLDDIFGFHPLAIEDTINYAQRPKIESYNHVGDAMTKGYFYMVFHGPDLETFRESLRTKELDLFVSDRYLVTIHEEQMRSIETVLARCTANPSGILSRGTDLLLHSILDYMVDTYEPILDYLEGALDELEERALSDPQPDVLGDIATKKKELLNLRRIVGPQREVIAQLTRGEVPFIRESTRIYLRDVQDHLIRVVEMIELYRDLVLGSRDIYLSSIGNNTNQIMKTLTIISVIGLPFTVVTGFFGMNFFDTEGLHRHGAFWGSVAVMLAAVAGLLTWFKMRKWI